MSSMSVVPLMANTARKLTNSSVPMEHNAVITNHAVDTMSETLAGLLALTSVNDNNKTILTPDIISDASDALQRFVQQQQPSTGKMTTEDNNPPDFYKNDSEHMLAHHAIMAAHQLCRVSNSMPPSQKKKKHTWQALQAAAEKLHDGSKSQESSALTVSIVFGALSLMQYSLDTEEEQTILQDDNQSDYDAAGSAKAAASALSSTICRNKSLRHAGRTISINMLRTFLIHAAHTDTFDLGILNFFAKAFKITGGKECSIEPHITAGVIKNAIREFQDMKVDQYDSIISDKKKIAGALALACQLQPWPMISPDLLVEAAIPFEYWHAAEEICRAAHKTSCCICMNNDKENWVYSNREQQENVQHTVERLIDAAMEDRMYRRADSLATSLYEAGGRSRYVEARFNHACETISKVIHRKQIPIVDRQIERVDKAVARVQQDTTLNGEVTPPMFQRNSKSLSSSSVDPSSEIRKFSIEKLEEAGDLTSANRLAAVFGLDEYIYDERAIMLATAMRRRRYLQYEDVLTGAVPSLITTPQELVDAFQELRKEPFCCGPFGLDAEWDEEIPKGAAILQLANPETVLLIDIPALLGIQEGVKAMEQTVGNLLNCGDSVVAGFACRQDLSRLRASPFVHSKHNQSHWLSGAQAVIDVQKLVGIAEPKLYKAGLSRVCQHYFHKPLDKAEQCSLWSARPLTEHQRSYAALDAWICVAIYQKLNSPTQIGCHN